MARRERVDIDDPRRPETIEKPRFNAGVSPSPAAPPQKGGLELYLLGLFDQPEPWDGIPIVGPIIDQVSEPRDESDIAYVYTTDPAVAAQYGRVYTHASFMGINQGDQPKYYTLYQGKWYEGVGMNTNVSKNTSVVGEAIVDNIQPLVDWLGYGTANAESIANSIAASALKQMVTRNYVAVRTTGGAGAMTGSATRPSLPVGQVGLALPEAQPHNIQVMKNIPGKMTPLNEMVSSWKAYNKLVPRIGSERAIQWLLGNGFVNPLK